MAMAETDLYATLGVPRTASDDEIRTAFRKLARKYHPDVNPGDHQAEARFKEVSAAHQILSDPEKRKLYDEFGAAGLREGFDPAQARAYRQRGAEPRGGGGVDSTAGDGGFDYGDLGDFADLFGGMFRRRAAARGNDLLASVELDFLEALRGTEVQLRAPDGRPVRVRIPPGAEDGARLVVRGQGGPGPEGAPPGDLIIQLSVRPHPRLRRQGLDLYLDLPVTVDEAYNGARVEIPTPDGRIELRVPPRSQPGTKLRLRGKGVTREGQRGDLYAVLEVRLPDREVPEVAEAARRLASAYSRPVREGLRL
jgi:curved DNA-binding protein